MSNMDYKQLESVRYRLNLYRRYFYWRKHGAIFVHVPKVAGTSVSHAVYGRALGHYPASFIESAFPKLFSTCFTFGFVRNPWARVLSAYKFAKAGSTGSMGMANPSRYQTQQFEDFETFIYEWLLPRDLLAEDFVFQPQSHFLLDGAGNVMVGHVGKLEDFQADIRVVEARLDRRLDVRHMNRTGSHSNYRQEYVSKEMIDLVGKKYQEDVEAFGYDF
jgi:hypothetical protein